jgi:IS5 family transposase
LSLAIPRSTKPKSGQVVLHAKALHGNPFRWPPLGPVITGLEALTGIETRRIHAYKGYSGHNAQKSASGSAAKCVESLPRSAARCVAVLQSSRSLGT